MFTRFESGYMHMGDWELMFF